MTIIFNDSTFFKDMNNVIQYSIGFLEGVQKGKNNLLMNVGKTTIEHMKEFIDQQARVDPQMYHHIYEWNQLGNPDGRLFDIDYKVTEGGLTFNGSLSQSKTIQEGSHTPFYNKAEIMEKGIPVTIRPREGSVLAFQDGEDTVFTKKPVIVEHPGGTHVMGAFENIFKSFFESYFTQSFMNDMGLRDYLKTPQAYPNNLRRGKVIGKAAGVEVGYNWISNAGGLNV